MKDQTWKQRALCRFVDRELFFPTGHDRERVAEAKAVCRGCPVIAECRDYAMRISDLVGVWGGLTESERNRLRRGRRRESLLYSPTSDSHG